VISGRYRRRNILSSDTFKNWSNCGKSDKSLSINCSEGSQKQKLNVNRRIMRSALTKDLNVWKVCTKMVLENFSSEQKLRTNYLARNLQQGCWKNTTFWKMSWLVMRVESSSTTPQKQRTNPPLGKFRVSDTETTDRHENQR